MKSRFWLIYGVISGLLLIACYIATANLSRFPFTLSDEEMAAIRGSWHTLNDYDCILVGGCPTEFCEPNSSHNYDQTGNDNYDECRSFSGKKCREEDTPYSSWYCKYLTYNDNNCSNPDPDGWQWTPLPDCTN